MAINKVAQYLNEHILGEVTSSKLIREKFSRDGSVLTIMPELIAHPRVTNDLRKIARFTWQLAEKGHIFPIIARGGGTDQTGGAIGKGVIVNTTAHLNNIICLGTKNKSLFAHVQPGVNFSNVNDALKSHGLIIPSFPTSYQYSTIGGAVANNAGGVLSGRYGQTGDWVNRLEIVLANGDLIETKKISKHELNKRKGLQTFEGEIYRKIDGLIEDNQDLIDQKIPIDSNDNAGYPGIAKVKSRDGSFDLTPLFVGSQGTLGIISEIVINATYYSNDEAIVVAVFDKPEVARDASDVLLSLKPDGLDLIDGSLFAKAESDYGKKFIFSNIETGSDNGAVLFVSFHDFSDGARKRKVKQTIKKLSKFETKIFTDNDYSLDELRAIRGVSSLVLQPNNDTESMPPLIDGASIPENRREEFISAVKELATKHHVELPLHIRWINGVIHTRPLLQLHQVPDKQKILKIIYEYIELVGKFGGSACVESSEGRLKATASHDQLDEGVNNLYMQIRSIFDPFNTLNPGVKQPNEAKDIITQINSDYNLTDFAKYSPKI